MELLTHGGEHHEIGDGGLVMMMATNSLSGAPNGLQIWPPDEEQEVTTAPSHGTR